MMKKKSTAKIDDEDSYLTLVGRLTVLFLMLLCWKNQEVLQNLINLTWKWLKIQWWYQTVYNETFFVVLWSFPAMLPYKLLDHFKVFHKYQ